MNGIEGTGKERKGMERSDRVSSGFLSAEKVYQIHTHERHYFFFTHVTIFPNHLGTLKFDDPILDPVIY